MPRRPRRARSRRAARQGSGRAGGPPGRGEGRVRTLRAAQEAVRAREGDAARRGAAERLGHRRRANSLLRSRSAEERDGRVAGRRARGACAAAIRRLGTVNLGAVAELEEIETRLAELCGAARRSRALDRGSARHDRAAQPAVAPALPGDLRRGEPDLPGHRSRSSSRAARRRSR